MGGSSFIDADILAVEDKKERHMYSFAVSQTPRGFRSSKVPRVGRGDTRGNGDERSSLVNKRSSRECRPNNVEI